MSENVYDIKRFGSLCSLKEDDLSQKLEEQCMRISEAVKNAEEKSIPSTIFLGLKERELANLTKTANTICQLLL